MPQATLYQITARHRARQFMPTALSDFTTDAGTQTDATLLLDPTWSLYSLDLPGNTAVFVRLPPDTDLSSANFIPQAQFDAATQVATVDLDALPALSETLPRPANLILLFSIGRCGTTLANHILNTTPGTFALSEPRAFVTLAMARAQIPPARAETLIAAATRFLFRPPQGQSPTSFALKLHSQCLYQAQSFHRAFPDARFLFMYRDAKAWANSFTRFFQNLGTPLILDPATLARTWSILTAAAPLSDLTTLDTTAPETPHAPVLAAAWAHNLAQVRDDMAAGVPYLPLHYDDLLSDRPGTIRRLLAHCALPDTGLPQALATFDRDSQEGTVIGRASTAQGFGPADYDSVIKTLQALPQPLPWDLRL